MTALDQALAVVFTAFCMLALFSFGLFFTFLFWRLSKVGCIVAALAIPVVLTGVPALFATFAQALSPLTFLLQQVGQFFAASPWGGIVVFLVVTAFFGWIGWMLIRRQSSRGYTFPTIIYRFYLCGTIQRKEEKGDPACYSCNTSPNTMARI